MRDGKVVTTGAALTKSQREASAESRRSAEGGLETAGPRLTPCVASPAWLTTGTEEVGTGEAETKEVGTGEAETKEAETEEVGTGEAETKEAETEEVGTGLQAKISQV